jgi:membrane protein YdbS with pleckstrin-like domain
MWKKFDNWWFKSKVGTTYTKWEKITSLLFMLIMIGSIVLWVVYVVQCNNEAIYKSAFVVVLSACFIFIINNVAQLRRIKELLNKKD